MTLTVAIIGRPNVGKSTLFNRLVGRKVALVDERPGVTRDWREGRGRIGDLAFRVLDTAGLEEAGDETLEGRMSRQTERALAHADVALFLVDARAGVTPVDRHFAQWLRAHGTRVILAANKAEGGAGEAGLYEAFSLGFGEPVALSAEHGEGLADLAAALLPLIEEAEAAEAEAAEGEEAERPVRLAIVGRPNVGKSTLVNALVGSERMLVGPEPGMTRDAIAVDWRYVEQPIELVDTAGLRRKARVTDRVERLSTGNTIDTIRRADVVVLIVEVDAILDRQDLTIARLVVDEGKALVIAVNKWDAATEREESLQRLRDRLETSLTQVRGVPTVTISALHGRGLERLMKAVLGVYATWNRRVPTAGLNRWLQGMLEAHPPPIVRGRRLKLRYMTQVKARPPTFALFSSRPADWPESYLRYLANGLRDGFGLDGVPLRLLLRGGENPYADKG